MRKWKIGKCKNIVGAALAISLMSGLVAQNIYASDASDGSAQTESQMMEMTQDEGSADGQGTSSAQVIAENGTIIRQDVGSASQTEKTAARLIARKK